MEGSEHVTQPNWACQLEILPFQKIMLGHKGSFQREKGSRQKNTRKTKKAKNKQTKKNTRLNKYILIYKVDGMTYILKSPRFSSRRHETTYGGKAMPHSVHVSCC